MSITCTLALATLTACGGGGGDDVVANVDLNSSLATPRPPTAATPTPTPTLPPPSVVQPAGAFNCAADAITCVEVASASSQTQGSVPVTFGQPFKAGDWQPTSQGLVAKVDGTTIPLQTDELSTHRDGSARFAVLSAQLTNLPAGQKRIINLYRGAKSNSTPNVPAHPDWNLELEAQVYDANGSVTTLVAQPQAQLVSQIASGSERRLAGAIASEYTVTLPFKNKATGATHPHLTARLHTRLVDGGQRIRTDVVMENTRTWTPDPSNITYSLDVKRNGSTIYTQPKFTHYHHARWHKVLWTGSSAEPQARVRHNMRYFLDSKATWNYDLSINVPEAVLAKWATDLQKLRTAQAALGPMGNAFLNPYFPSTGTRSEIGPLPRWTATYLITQDERLREVMFANADAAASVPIHYRDEKTAQVLDVVTNPKVSVLYGTSNPALPASTPKDTIWHPDTSHQGSYTYVPYLITGDTFYLDEMAYWAGWNVASLNPGYRQETKGLVDANQVRAQAWAIRSIAEVAHALPNSHIQKNYFNSILANNLAHYATYQHSSMQSPIGAMIGSGSTDHTAPWQNDFVGTIFSLLVENNEPGAKSMLDWVNRFNIGRFENEANGFCMAHAPGYFWKIRKDTGEFITSWADLYATNYPAEQGKACSTLPITEGYPHLALGYAAIARGTLAAASNAGLKGAASAYQAWKAKTPLMDADFRNDPTWAIIPR